MVSDLRPHLTGRTVTGVELRLPSIVRHPEPWLFQEGVAARRIEAATRRGKYILLHLDAPGSLLVVHLGMTGQLRYVDPETPLPDHTHAVFALDDGFQLRYRDVRRFGRLLLGTEAELIAAGKLPRLGPEPLADDFTAADLARRLKGRRAPLKALLLDQSVVAGVGNIYADESCFRAGIRPDREAGGLSRRAVAKLHASLRETLLMGIANRGSSVDSYRDAWGNKGTHQERLQVYGRGGEPCFRCGRPLRLVRLAGRATVFCTRCQR